MRSKIRIGTRGSTLAFYHSELVKNIIRRHFPMVEMEIVKIKTGGDMIRRRSAAPFDTKRIYTREIEEALLQREIDCAVHSAKDMGASLPSGLIIASVVEREDARDCLLSRGRQKLAELPSGARIGTSSLRRKTQLLRRRSDFVVEEIHGNIDSRIRKLTEGKWDALVLAYAGLKRLGLTHFVSEVLPEEQFYPAPGQGAILVEVRQDDTEIIGMCALFHHKTSGIRVECERAFLRQLEGGCQLPCGITTSVEKGVLKANGAVFSLDGLRSVEDRLEGPLDKPSEIGEILARKILEEGGSTILEAIRDEGSKKNI